MTSIAEWAANAVGRYIDVNVVPGYDCTDVPNDMLKRCVSRDYHIYGNGGDVAGNAASYPSLFRVEPFSTEIDYPLGTIFSATVPGSPYGHTGVLSHVENGVWQAFQQDTFAQAPCWLGPVMFEIHTVAIPLWENNYNTILSEEDNMPITEDDLNRISQAVWLTPMVTNAGTANAIELLVRDTLSGEAATSQLADLRMRGISDDDIVRIANLIFTAKLTTNAGELTVPEFLIRITGAVESARADDGVADIRVLVNGKEL